jgi:hypothetical protein
MEQVLSRKVSRKVRKQLQREQWTQNHVERTGRSTRRSLRLSIWDLQNQFYRQLDETKKKRSKIETERDEAEKAAEFWKGLLGQTAKLDASVQQIDVTDRSAESESAPPE